MALYRNCLTRVRRERWFRRFDQIVSSVSRRPLYAWIASLVDWRFVIVVSRWEGEWRSIMPRYALGRDYFFLDPESRHEFRSPSPTYLPNSPFPASGTSFKFKERFMYERRLRDNYRQSLFLAEYQGRTVVVKFCVRYAEDAPRVLANAGLAPRLHYCSKVVGGLFMVVMEQVDGRDWYSEFRHRDLPQSVLDDIERALGKLHGAMLVYGDMRRPNIMVVKKSKCRNDDSDSDSDLNEWRGLLIDFDWSGRVW